MAHFKKNQLDILIKRVLENLIDCNQVNLS